MKNTSGLYPKGNRVVVKPDQIEEKTEGGIILPGADRDRHQLAQSIGTFIAAGPDAWLESTEFVERLIDGAWKVVERRTSKYREPFAKPGDRVAFAKYAGLPVFGEDGEEYRILNDMDITIQVGKNVDFTELTSRQRVK